MKNKNTVRLREVGGAPIKLTALKGHKLLGYKCTDGDGAANLPPEILLEFSDEPAQEQIFTIEEQQLLWEAIQEVKVNGEPHSVAFNGAMNLVMERIFKNTYSREQS